MTALLYAAAILAAFAIAFGVLGIFALIDMFRINHRKDYD
jgi:hypothetical protein